jgi:nicotinamide-nucleotide amidase
MGQGESMIADTLENFEKKLPAHIKLAYLPNYGAVKLRLSCKGRKSRNSTKGDRRFVCRNEKPC